MTEHRLNTEQVPWRDGGFFILGDISNLALSNMLKFTLPWARDRNGQYPESPPTLAVLWFCEEIWFVLAAIHFRIASVCSFFLQSYTAGQVVVTSFLPILSPFSFQRISKENPNQPLKSWPYSVSLKKDTFQLQFQIHTQFTHSASSVIKQDWEKMLSSLAAQRTTLIQLRILFGWK